MGSYGQFIHNISGATKKTLTAGDHYVKPGPYRLRKEKEERDNVAYISESVAGINIIGKSGLIPSLAGSVPSDKGKQRASNKSDHNDNNSEDNNSNNNNSDNNDNDDNNSDNNNSNDNNSDDNNNDNNDSYDNNNNNGNRDNNKNSNDNKDRNNN
ncbi:hypothetical protein RRF57_012519 [Xylaria bambusicola]|uniref:Uncharacterized protein n=1 Tax=Xylaria bambusicola TaxID=326684 RepID=A0AAN7UVB3_9PEZI